MGCFEPPILRIFGRLWIRIGYVDLATGLLPGSHVSIPCFLVKHPNSCYTRTLHVPWCCLCFLCKRIGNQRYIYIYFVFFPTCTAVVHLMNFHGTSKSQCWFQLFLEFSPPKKKGEDEPSQFWRTRIFFSEGGWFKFNYNHNQRGVIQCLYLDPMGVFTSSPTESSYGAAKVFPSLGPVKVGRFACESPETSAVWFFFMTSDCKWDFLILEHILEKTHAPWTSGVWNMLDV